jgi:hypothetical protein
MELPVEADQHVSGSVSPMCAAREASRTPSIRTDRGRETELPILFRYVLSDRCTAKPIRVRKATN